MRIVQPRNEATQGNNVTFVKTNNKSSNPYDYVRIEQENRNKVVWRNYSGYQVLNKIVFEGLEKQFNKIKK